MARLRTDFAAGALDAALAAGATSMSSPGLADLGAVASPDVAAISLYTADANGRITKKEIVHVTAHTASATTATITRGREGTADQAWSSGDKWEHGATTEDFGTAWTAYTPAWTAVTTNPTIGNGTLTGAYTQIGKTVFFRINLTLGSTSTAGSGVWHLSYPVTAVSLASTHGIVLSGVMEDAGTTGYGILTGVQVDTTKFRVDYHDAATNGVSKTVTHNLPFAWAANDFIRLMGVYEAA